VRAAYGDEVGNDELGELAMAMLLTHLDKNTVDNYDGKVNLFFKFCTEDKRDPFQPSRAAALRYIAWLGEKGTIAGENLQPYLSAVNKFHSSIGLEPVMLGNLVAQVRSGLLGCQVASARRDSAPFMPAMVVLDIENEAWRQSESCATQTAYERLLPLVATVVPFIFFHRASTSGKLRGEDLWLERFSDTRGSEVEYICLRETHAKGKSRQKTKSIIKIPVSGLSSVARLLRRFLQLRAQFGHAEFLWLRRGELPPSAPSGHMTALLRDALQQVGQEPAAWASHALQHGAASAAAAEGVTDDSRCHFGGWSIESTALYIHVEVLCDAASAHYFGWLVRRR